MRLDFQILHQPHPLAQSQPSLPLTFRLPFWPGRDGSKHQLSFGWVGSRGTQSVTYHTRTIFLRWNKEPAWSFHGRQQESKNVAISIIKNKDNIFSLSRLWLTASTIATLLIDFPWTMPTLCKFKGTSKSTTFSLNENKIPSILIGLLFDDYSYL